MEENVLAEGYQALSEQAVPSSVCSCLSPSFASTSLCVLSSKPPAVFARISSHGRKSDTFPEYWSRFLQRSAQCALYTLTLCNQLSSVKWLNFSLFSGIPQAGADSHRTSRAFCKLRGSKTVQRNPDIPAASLQIEKPVHAWLSTWVSQAALAEPRIPKGQGSRGPIQVPLPLCFTLMPQGLPSQTSVTMGFHLLLTSKTLRQVNLFWENSN